MYPAELSKATRRTPRMDRQIDKIIKILGTTPMTVPQLAGALFVSDHSAGYYIRLLHKLSRVHISGWLPTEANKPTRIYSAGFHEDVKYVSKRKKSVDTRVHDSKAKLLELLALPQTVKQLAERSGISTSRTRDFVAELKKEGRVYIKAWILPDAKGSQAPMYAVGNEPDAVRIRRSKQTARRAANRNAKKLAKNVFSTIQQQPSPEGPGRKYVHLPDGPVRLMKQAA